MEPTTAPPEAVAPAIGEPGDVTPSGGDAASTPAAAAQTKPQGRGRRRKFKKVTAAMADEMFSFEPVHTAQTIQEDDDDDTMFANDAEFNMLCMDFEGVAANTGACTAYSRVVEVK